jgi:hypothetical protein
VNGATQSSYKVHEQTFGDNGYLLVQIWSHQFEASDAKYVIKQAHVVIQPTGGGLQGGIPDDIEDLQFDLPSPAPFECQLSDWQPRLNSAGVTLAGSVNIDSSPGVNVGAEVTVGVDGTQVERGGSDAIGGVEGDAEWDIDFDDFSTTPSQRVALDFYAYWRCPKDAFFIESQPTLVFEIDEWGRDPQYRLSYQDDDVTDATEGQFKFTKIAAFQSRSLPDLSTERYGLVIDSSDASALRRPGKLTVRARVYGREMVEVAAAQLELAEVPGATWQMIAISDGLDSGLHYSEWGIKAKIPEGLTAVTPIVTANIPNQTSIRRSVAAIAVVQEVLVGGTAKLGPGPNVLQLKGQSGMPFVALLPERRSLQGEPLLRLQPHSDEAVAITGNQFMGTFESSGPTIELLVAPDAKGLAVVLTGKPDATVAPPPDIRQHSVDSIGP